jgi:hypothetical protein
MAKRTSRSRADDQPGAAGEPDRAGRSRGSAAAPGRTDITSEQQTIGQQPPSASAPGGSQAASEASREQKTSRSMSSEPTEEEIRLRAYHRYLERGGGHGKDYDDWLEAERELRNRK